MAEEIEMRAIDVSQPPGSYGMSVGNCWPKEQSFGSRSWGGDKSCAVSGRQMGMDVSVSRASEPGTHHPQRVRKPSVGQGCGPLN